MHEKSKLLVTKDFFFLQNCWVSDNLDLMYYIQTFSFTNVFVNPFPKQTLVFTCLQYKSFENTAEKGEIALNDQFLLFPVFSICLDNFLTFSLQFNIVIYKLFKFERV